MATSEEIEDSIAALECVVYDLKNAHNEVRELESRIEELESEVEQLNDENADLERQLDDAQSELEEIRIAACQKCESLINGLNQKRSIQKENKDDLQSSGR